MCVQSVFVLSFFPCFLQDRIHPSFLLNYLRTVILLVSPLPRSCLCLLSIHLPLHAAHFCSVILSVGRPLFTFHEKVTLVFFIESVPQRIAQGEFHIHTSPIPTMHKYGFDVLLFLQSARSEPELPSYT